MLGIDFRAAKYTWTAALVVLLLMVVYMVRGTLFVFTVALLFAYLLSPLVNFLDRVFPAKRSRTPALAIVYLLLIGFLVLFGFVVGSRALEQANALIARMPELIAKLDQPDQSELPLPETVRSMKATVLSAIRTQIKEHSKDIGSLVPKAGLKVLSYAGELIFVFIVPILSFFLLKDSRAILSAILGSVDDGPPRALLRGILADIHVLLAQYMRALLILCAATFVFYSIFFSFMGVPYAILLASIAFPLEFIPVVGPLTAGITILLVAGFSNYSHLLWLLLFLGAYRIFQDYVLSPHLMSAEIELHPVVVIFGVFAGGEIGGVAGTFLSVPVLAMLRIIYRRIERARFASQLTPVSV